MHWYRFVWLCPTCNAQHYYGAATCQTCGATPLRKQPNPAYRTREAVNNSTRKPDQEKTANA